jgi:hypothetical protein
MSLRMAVCSVLNVVPVSGMVALSLAYSLRDQYTSQTQPGCLFFVNGDSHLGGGRHGHSRTNTRAPNTRVDFFLVHVEARKAVRSLLRLTGPAEQVRVCACGGLRAA